MQKLSAIDASFLYTETDNVPNHVSSFQVVELPEGTTVDKHIRDIKRGYKNRMHLVPYLYRKVRFTPGNFDHPVWVTDHDLDLDNHIFKVVLPKPGTFQQLEEKIAEIHATRLDRDRPLWKLGVITGLENSRHVAYYSCAHHACIDGVSGTAVTETLLDPTPEIRKFKRPRNFPTKDDGGLPELLGMSFQNLMRAQLDGPARMMGMMESVSRITRRALDPHRDFGTGTRPAPRTHFNHSIQKERTFAAADLDMNELKAIKNAAGCTLNDVYMAICAGGLRRYLSRNEELPEVPLIAGCPVSMRKPGDTSINTQATTIPINLATDIDDPVRRLYAIQDSANTAKEVLAETSADFSPEFSVYGLPAWLTQSAQFADAIGLADAMPMNQNLIISNVPGPRQTLYSQGARVLRHYPVSIPSHGMGVNITVQSYVDLFCVGITACARALPDARVLRDDIMDSYQELRDAVIPETPQIHLAEHLPGPRPVHTMVVEPVHPVPEVDIAELMPHLHPDLSLPGEVRAVVPGAVRGEVPGAG